MNPQLEKYLAGRSELKQLCAERLKHDHLPVSALRAVFWGDFYADEDHLPVAWEAAALPRGSFTAPDFGSPVTHAIERIGG